MGYRQPPVHTRFKPGVSGNPSGRHKNYLSPSKVKSVIDKFLALNKKDLEKVVADNNKSSALELMIASTILFCIKSGDYSRLEILLARAVGRVKEVEEEVDATQEVSQLSMGDLLSLVKPAGVKDEA